MSLTIILIIILIGLILIALEVFLIPGTTLVGFLGGAALLTGVAMVYVNYGNTWGSVSLGTSGVLVLVALYFAFKTIDSNKLAMKGEITGRVNELETHFKVGDTGVTVSELRPNGKAMFNENKAEVFSTGDYIPRDTAIEITKITNNRIFVKPIKT